MTAQKRQSTAHRNVYRKILLLSLSVFAVVMGIFFVGSNKDSHEGSIDTALAASVPQRALSLDVARRFYSIQFLKNTIDTLASLHYNTLHLHLSDDQAFRLESATIPQAVSAQHYTKQEMSDLVSYASLRGIVIVPEIDMPGHMKAILASPGQSSLYLQTPSGRGSLDLSQPGARTLVQSLLDEYLPLFPSHDWVIGGDEWMVGDEADAFPQLTNAARAQFGPNATIRDLQYDFFNWVDNYLVSKGKVAHIWNDQIVAGSIVTINKDIIIDHWYGASDPSAQQLASQGYKLVNSNWNKLYAQTDTNSYPTAKSLSSFSMTQFALGSKSQTVPETSVVGVQMAVWTDQPDTTTDAQVSSQLTSALTALANRLWGSLSPTPTPIQSGPTATPTPTKSLSPTPTMTLSPTPTPVAPTAVPTTTASAHGLLGTYYDNADFTGPSLTRVDSNINFNWGAGAPANGIAADTFSVRWQGYIVPKYSQTHRFYATTDDGVRLWVNNKQIITNWRSQPATEVSGTIALTAGQKYPIVMEYYDNTENAVAQLRWSSNSQSKQIIPSTQLYTP